MKTSITLFATVALISLSKLSAAQDTIVKINNDIILGKIIEISPSEIKYNRTDMPDGPVYSVRKTELVRIKYRNGTVDEFSQTRTNAVKTSEPVITAPDTSPRYILTMTDGTQLRGKIISETKTEVVFLDNNFGEKKIGREKIKSLVNEFGDLVRVFTLTDGSIITGKIVNKTSEATVIETKELGIITLPESKIKLVRDMEEATITDAGKIWFKNPNCTRYLFAPSAMQLKKGEGYYQNIYGAGNAVNFGLNDHITIGGGLVGPLGAYLNVKAGVKLGELVHVGGGAILGNGFFPVNGNNLGAGLGFAVLTIGNYDHNITVGSGYGFVNSGGSTGLIEKPVFIANGMARLGKKYALVTENWIVNVKGNMFNSSSTRGSHYDTFFSYAFRYMGQKSTLDAGFINTPELIKQGWYVGIPYIGFVIRFGNYKEN